MKKTLFITAISVSILYMVSCSKSPDTAATPCTNKPVQDDSTALKNFATANNITPTKDASGLYYQIITPGTGSITANNSSQIEVSYRGSFLNGNLFDTTATGKTASFYLYQLIPAWQIGIPKIKAGGRIKLLVPSALGYGCTGAGVVIPANTPIYFDITLVNVQ